ncbi:MAG: DUF1592 domain-containing protein [Armatimonas sp.]
MATLHARWPFFCVLPVLGLMGLSAMAQAPKQPSQTATTMPAVDREVLPLIQKYCLGCHTGKQGAGGIALDSDKSLTALLKRRTTWDRVPGTVRDKRMPPVGMPQPTPAERAKIADTLDAAFTQDDCKLNDPGRVTMRRLNRAEYNNTVHDLLGVFVKPADEFPSDDVGYGFDNIGDVLTISPLLMEKYLTAAEKVAKEAVLAPGETPRQAKLTAAQLNGTGGQLDIGDGFQLGRTGDTAYAPFDFPVAGTYTVRIRTHGDQEFPEPAKMGILFDDKPLQNLDVPNEIDKPLVATIPVTVTTPGRHTVAMRFLNNNDPKTRKKDRNLYIHYVELQLPEGTRRGLRYDLPKDNTQIAWDAAMRETMAPLAKRAYRRPVTPAEMDKLVTLSRLARQKNQRDEFPAGLRLALRALLVSPSFLFRPEPDAVPGVPATRALNDYELATRLSYFLWSSMPDSTLLALADQGKLKDPKVLVEQAKRMLKDPRSAALADNFAGQWLQLRKINVVQPADRAFSEPLRRAMAIEPARFFTGIVQEDRNVLEFLDADYTYVNEALAKHYGLSGVTGEDFRKVPLAPGQRGGLLAMAGVLTLTSNPARTSPVKRGKWVLENILGTPPPPPPPNVPELDKPGEKATATTLRKRLELHRANPTCASCHAQMDGIGLALENYDLLGRWRDKDADQPIDASGTLPDGNKFTGPTQLKQVLLNKKTLFTRTLTERALTYALGRGVERTDRCNLDAMTASVAKNGYKFSAVVEAIVTSPPFRERRDEK